MAMPAVAPLLHNRVASIIPNAEQASEELPRYVMDSLYVCAIPVERIGLDINVR